MFRLRKEASAMGQTVEDRLEAVRAVLMAQAPGRDIQVRARPEARFVTCYFGGHGDAEVKAFPRNPESSKASRPARPRVEIFIDRSAVKRLESLFQDEPKVSVEAASAEWLRDRAQPLFRVEAPLSVQSVADEERWLSAAFSDLLQWVEARA